ncbi:hypothetical protein [uncultured Phascolarctobacterium sp.]|uniref:hypothetical protein n=1 Tax=uncultured Phascolarctobacterium sp. TaxID=512296 RepID=UPI002069B83B|nr:hypothetical protein [uncultured Phascolarctobacterium sp.]DAG55965.1 MAG TPA: hypothetical protein [Bacteriophage sp.]
MASTTGKLEKIHVFPSYNSFNKNISSVGSDDFAFVKIDLLDKLAGNTTPTLVALIDWDTMKTRNGGTDVRNINNTSTGIKAYGGDSSFPTTSGGSDSRKGTIMLKESYTLYDKILVVGNNDSGTYSSYTLWDVWELQKAFSEGSYLNFFGTSDQYWGLYSGVQSGTTTHPLSTDTVWYTEIQNCSIIEIYGVKY